MSEAVSKVQLTNDEGTEIEENNTNMAWKRKQTGEKESIWSCSPYDSPFAKERLLMRYGFG